MLLCFPTTKIPNKSIIFIYDLFSVTFKGKQTNTTQKEFV